MNTKLWRKLGYTPKKKLGNGRMVTAKMIQLILP